MVVAQEIRRETRQQQTQTAEARMAFAHPAWRRLRAGLLTPMRRFQCDPRLCDAIVRFRAGAEGPILALLRVRSRPGAHAGWE